MEQGYEGVSYIPTIEGGRPVDDLGRAASLNRALRRLYPSNGAAIAGAVVASTSDLFLGAAAPAAENLGRAASFNRTLRRLYPQRRRRHRRSEPPAPVVELTVPLWGLPDLQRCSVASNQEEEKDPHRPPAVD